MTRAIRVTVNLNEKSVDAMERLVDLTKDTKTECINKALQAYCLIQEAQLHRGGVWFQDKVNELPIKTVFS